MFEYYESMDPVNDEVQRKTGVRVRQDDFIFHDPR